MAVIVLNMNIMHKINNSAVMDKSAENPATTYTLDRYLQADEKK